MSPPHAYSPSAKGDDEEASRRASLDSGKTPEIVRAAPQDDSRSAGYMGQKAPTETDGAGRVLLDPQPDSIPETYTAPESGKRLFPKRGGVQPVTSVQPEAPDRLLEALQGASIVDERCAHMGTVIERVQSAKNGLTEACASLLAGFEVSNVIVRRISQRRQYPLMLCAVFGKKSRTEDQN